MVSIAVVNAILNAALWALHSFLAFVMESIYVMCAKLELHNRGSTRATNADETDAVKWFLRILFPPEKRRSNTLSRRCCEGGPCGTAPWVVALMISGLLFLPAELVAETGINIKEHCQVGEIVQEDGVCATKAFEGSAFGTAANALFIQRTLWIDKEWDCILAGSSRSMDRREVRHLGRIGHPIVRKSSVLARNCTSLASTCRECGSVTITRSGDAFGYTVTALRTSVGELSNTTVKGFVVTDGKIHTLFVFQGLVDEQDEMSSFLDLKAIHVHGREALLTKREFGSIIQSDTDTIDLELNNTRTRVLDITCYLAALNSTQLAEALAIYRKLQLERPRKPREEPTTSFSQLEPLGETEVLQAAFAFMADDQKASCRQPVKVYRSCGEYQWKRALFTASITLFFMLSWLVICCKTKDLDPYNMPYDSTTWRRFALDHMSRTGLQAQMEVTPGGKKVVIKKLNDEDLQSQDFRHDVSA